MSETHLHPHHTAPAANAVIGIRTVVEHKNGVVTALAKQRAAQAAYDVQIAQANRRN